MAKGEGEALAVGKLVNKRFQILRVVGQGGLGTVYQVRDTVYGTNNVYALKELIDQSPGARKQFTQEAKWLQALNHDHIPKVREYFEWEHRLYLVMDFVDGENLDQKLRRMGGRGLPEANVIQWILPICDALQYLHTRTPPILHRDVKPSNIIVNASGHPVLVDLGIAKEHGPGASQTATFVRKAGTEGYAPPEQYTSAGQTGPWSDVYSLGATLYELLTGCIPPTAVERVALDVRLVPLRELNPEISPHVASAIVKALSIRPTERYQYVADFAASLMAPDAIQPSMPPFASAPTGPTSRSTLGPMPSPPPASRISTPSAPMRGTPPRMPSNPAMTPANLPNLTPPTPANLPTLTPPPRSYSGASLYDSAGAVSGGLAAGGASGASLARPPVATASEDARSGRHWYALPIVWIAAVAAVLTIAVVLGVTLHGLLAPLDRSTPQATITGYFTALEAQDDAQAWQYTSLSRNNPSQQSTFISELQADDERYGRVTSFQVTQTSTVSSGRIQATVTVDRANQQGSPLTYTLVVTQYDGSTWLIDSVTGS